MGINEGKFWDYRPFSRVVRGWKAFLAMKDYVHVNQLMDKARKTISFGCTEFKDKESGLKAQSEARV